MAKKEIFDDSDGVWRTIGGRRVFIKNGQDLASAMKESGKFGNREARMKAQQQEDIDNWRRYANANQKSLNRASNPDSKERFRKERDDAMKYVKEGEKAIHDYDNPKEYKGKLDESMGKHIDKEQMARNNERYEKKEKDKALREEKLKNIKADAENAYKNNIDKNDFALDNAKYGIDTDESTKAYNEAIEKKMNKLNKELEEKENARISKEKAEVENYYEEQERQALRSGDMSYGYSKKALENISNKELDNYIAKQEELVKEYTNKYNQDLTYDQRKTRNRQDTLWDKGMKAKYEQQLKNAQEEKARREEYLNKYFRKDDNAKNDNKINNTLRQKAYQKYLKEHPNSKMTFNEFKDMKKQ